VDEDTGEVVSIERNEVIIDRETELLDEHVDQILESGAKTILLHKDMEGRADFSIIYNTLQKMDHSLIDAAKDLGAKPFRVFIDVVLPLSMPGVYSGILMVFMPTISTFAVSELLTMNNIKLFGSIIQENINVGLLNYGSALSLILLIIIGLTTFFDEEGNK
jgi:ABC-type glycerol-3-phosphate transport system permease component